MEIYRSKEARGERGKGEGGGGGKDVGWVDRSCRAPANGKVGERGSLGDVELEQAASCALKRSEVLRMLP